MYNHLLQQKYLLTHSDTLYWGHKVNWYIKGYLTFSILTSSIIFTNAFYLFCPGTFSSPWDSDTMGPLFAKQNGGHNLAISWTVLFGLKIFHLQNNLAYFCLSNNLNFTLKFSDLQTFPGKTCWRPRRFWTVNLFDSLQNNTSSLSLLQSAVSNPPHLLGGLLLMEEQGGHLPWNLLLPVLLWRAAVLEGQGRNEHWLLWLVSYPLPSLRYFKSR